MLWMLEHSTWCKIEDSTESSKESWKSHDCKWCLSVSCIFSSLKLVAKSSAKKTNKQRKINDKFSINIVISCSSNCYAKK